MFFEFAFGRKPIATALIVGGLLATSAPAAHAQFFNFFFHSDGLDAGDVQNMLEDRGMALVAPLRRNGSVYVADVEGPRGGRMRLIVDAESGRIVQRFRVASPHYYSDYNGPRPPADMGESQSNSVVSTSGAPPAVITFGQSIARGDDPTSPNVLTVPNGNDDGAKLRSKPQAKPHKKIELTPVPQQQPAQSASSPAPETKPPVHADAASPAPASASKAVVVAPAAAPSPAPAAPAASSKAKPAVNDVPVTPLD